MNQAAIALTPKADLHLPRPRALLRIVRAWGATSTGDARDAYLARSVDHDDLALRTRHSDEMERRTAKLAMRGPWC